MPLKNHIQDTFKLSDSPTPPFKMWLSALSVTLPLIVGYLRDETYFSMFGALMCLVYYLNDNFGPLKKRIIHLWVVFICLMICFFLGSYLTNHPLLISIVLFALSFTVGKTKNHGIELERLLLFMTLQFLTASADPQIAQSMVMLFIYSFFSFLLYQLLIVALSFLKSHSESEIKSKRDILKHISKMRESNYFSLICALLTTGSYLISILLKFSHANWIVGTALIVILPDSKLGIYKSMQRILGTFAGVIISALAIHFIHDPRIIILFVFIAAYTMPIGLSKNYWLGNISIAALIIFFLEFAFPQSIETNHLAYWRIVDITIGSLIGVLSALILNPRLLLNRLK